MRKTLTALDSLSGWSKKHRILEKNLANSITRNHNSSLPNWNAHFRWWSMRFNSGWEFLRCATGVISDSYRYLYFCSLVICETGNSLAEFPSELVYGTWAFSISPNDSHVVGWITYVFNHMTWFKPPSTPSLKR